MTGFRLLGAAILAGLISATPAAACDCGHCARGYDGCWGRGSGGRNGPPAGRWGSNGGAAASQTLDGKVAEVIYLPGADAGSAMVEIRVQAAGQPKLVRLAPVGFLKQSGAILREGDTVRVTGFAVSGMEGDVIVATELRQGDKALALRDARGLPVW